MLSWLSNAWRVPELRRRVLFTGLVLGVYRFGSWMPAPGIDSDAIKNYFSNNGNTVLGLLNLFSGSALSRFSVFALGIMPYVTASIILQLLAVVVPKLEQLQKEGEAGYAKINQYTRYLTVALAALQSLGYVLLFTRAGNLQADTGRIVLIVVTLTAGCTLRSEEHTSELQSRPHLVCRLLLEKKKKNNKKKQNDKKKKIKKTKK